MKWLLIFITLSSGSNSYCDGPLPLLKHGDEMYDSQEECETAFHDSRFYKSSLSEQVVGFCLGPIKPMMLSPEQLTNRIDRPSCH